MSPAIRRALVAACVALAGFVVVVVAVAPPEECPTVDAGELRTAATTTVGWMIDNQAADGTWLYEYARSTDTIVEGYNVVRHAGLVEALYLAESEGIAGAGASADRGLSWALDHRVDHGDWTSVTDSSTLQVGTNALLLAGLVQRRLDTGDAANDDLMRRLARFIVAQTEPSGAVLAYYDLVPDRPRAATYSKYYTGEAYWALARLHRLAPDEGWGEVADRIGAYLASERDEVEGYWPPIPDHWAGYGLAETAAFAERPPGTPLTDDEVDYARRQAGLFGQQVRAVSQRFGPWGVLVRGTFVPRGGGYGVVGEGLTGLWRAAQLDDRLADVRGPIAARASCMAGLALRAQSDAEDAASYAAPTRVAGAWFRDEVTRMDDQQHALSALLLTVPIVEAAGATGGSHPAPSAWLWFVVVIAVLNPVRAASGILRRPDAGPGDPGDPVEPAGRPVALALAGSLLGAALLLVAGASSGFVLDVLDVSRPSWRLAAGALCAASALADLWRRMPSSVPALAGARAAIVPVAVPLVARPALLVAGLGAVADLGLWRYAGALAVAVALVVGLTAVLPAEGAGARVATWTMRLLAAVAVVGGILLVVDGVYDV